MSTPDQVPAELYAGDTWAWARELADYPATTHTAAWYFEKADQNFSVSASASGTAFVASVAAASTATYRPGRYQWRLLVTRISDSARFVAERGYLEVQPDPAAAGNRDWRSHARRTLDLIEAVIEGKASTDQLATSIDGVSLSRYSWAELTALHDRYRAMVAKEEADARAADGRPSGRRILTRMT